METMKTYTTDPGIKLLFPVVPKNSTAHELHSKDAKTCYLDYWLKKDGTGENIEDTSVNVPFDSKILGTCWRENGKLVCEGFDPDFLCETDGAGNWRDYMKPGEWFFSVNKSFDSWARREGIEIAEGEFMNVVLKVN